MEIVEKLSECLKTWPGNDSGFSLKFENISMIDTGFILESKHISQRMISISTNNIIFLTIWADSSRCSQAPWQRRYSLHHALKTPPHLPNSVDWREWSESPRESMAEVTRQVCQCQ